MNSADLLVDGHRVLPALLRDLSAGIGVYEYQNHSTT
jgi:hypothetical protein